MKLLICTQIVDEKDPTLGFFTRWLQEFATHAEEVSVICLQEGEYHLPSNVHLYSLGKEKGVPFLHRLTYALRFYRILWRVHGRYDVVFIHMNPEYVLLGGLLWRLFGKKIGLWYEHKSVTLWLRTAAVLSTSTFSASKEGFRLHSRKSRIMGHGIDTKRFIPEHIPAAQVRLMTSGRIAPTKRLDVIIDAFLLVKKEIPATLSVFGAPTSPEGEEYRKALAATLTAAGENAENVLRGSVPHAEMPLRRASADYFLHASETGSLDKAVLDAIWSGVIPLSSSEAYAGLFMGFEQHLTYPKGDAQALAQRVKTLRALAPEERSRIRDTLKERVQSTHSLQALTPRILAILMSDTLKI